MNRGRFRRIEKLEQKFEVDDRIPIYVELQHKETWKQRVEELIAAGALKEEDRERSVFWLNYRHYNKWQVDDEDTRRLNEQAQINTPCATWLKNEQAECADQS